MVFDPSRDRLVLYGGTGFAPAPLGRRDESTWTWDGDVWRRHEGTSPGVRFAASICFDDFRNVAVLFGGSETTSLPTDTWTWDGERWAQVATNGPPGRHGAAMVSLGGGVMLLFGGQNASLQKFADTWLWDGTQWIALSGPGPSPSARSGASMAFDSTRGRAVLFGGESATQFLDDTWEWDTSTGWQPVQVAGAVPPRRSGHSMYFDPVAARSTIFGGAELGLFGTTQRADTWTWDGATWTEIVNSGPSPSARVSAAIAYDSIRQRPLLYGGADVTTPQHGDLGDLWTFDGNAWSSLAETPSRRLGRAAAFDEARGEIVMIGGTQVGSAADCVTWLWNGRNWRSVNGPGPNLRTGHALAYDPLRERVVLFGGLRTTSPVGYVGDTWEWDGSAWTRAATTGPSPRYQHALAFDSTRGTILLFGGFGGVGVSGETWEWDGVAWTQLAGAAPPARLGHVMATDRRRGRVVMHGGSPDLILIQGVHDDTWEWNGTNWQQVAIGVGVLPAARWAHAMAYDERRGCCVLTGGANASYTTIFDDVWKWDGVAWTPEPAFGRGPSYEHTLTYDASRDRIVEFTAGNLALTMTRRPDVTLLGAGCPGSNTLPPLLRENAGSAPVLGSTWSIDVVDLPVGAAPFMVAGLVGFDPMLSLDPIGMTGCILGVDPLSVSPLSVSGLATATFALTIPLNPDVVGLSLFVQSIVLDATANPAGATTSQVGVATVRV